MGKYKRYTFGVGGHFCPDLAGQFIPYAMGHPACKCDVEALKRLQDAQNSALELTMKEILDL
jgi:hypothetical protein